MAENIFELGINLIETLITIDFLTRYFGCKYNKPTSIIAFCCTWLVSFCEISFMNYFVAFEGIAGFIPVVIDFLYSLIFLKGRVLIKLWISVLTEVIILIIAVGTNLAVCSIIGYDAVDMMTVFNYIRVASVVITKIVFFYTTRLLLKFRYKKQINNKDMIMLILIPMISMFSLTSLMFAAMNNDEISKYILFGMVGIVFANIITYYFFTKMSKEYETNLKVKLLKQNNENAKKELENAQAFVSQMKSVRHDIKNQLLIIQNHIDARRYTQASEYVKEITDCYLPGIRNFINSENDAFNAIVNAKIIICSQKDIFIQIREMQGTLNGFNLVDTGVLFGNLLDNAIEAAEKTRKRNIRMEIKNDKEYISIVVANSIDSPVISKNMDLQTTKDDKELHGIGLKNIRSIVKKYNGMIDFFEENQEFCCHILLDKSKILEKSV